MSNMKIASTQYAHAYAVDQEVSKEVCLKGLSIPTTESVEHSRFSRKLDNKVCSEIYAVSVNTVAKSIQGATKARQLTGTGEGAGGG